MDKKNRPPAEVFLIINLPVWGLLLLSIILTITSFLIPFDKFWFRLFFWIPAWQSICAALFLFRDFPRKYENFNRLIRSVRQGAALRRAGTPFRSTPCGLSILFAVSRVLKRDSLNISGGTDER